MSGYRKDLQGGNNSTSSNDYVWNIRTKPDLGVILITGFNFYTKTTNNVDFKLWTRLGTFKGFNGTFEGWELFARGKVKGCGISRYIKILDDHYDPISIPSGGGAKGNRAFYFMM